MSKLQDKVIAITGGNSGIGLAAAHAFIAEGARVAIFGRNQATLDRAVDALGERALGIAGDVTRLVDLRGFAGEVEARFGQVDALFANAGLGVFAPLEMVDEDAYDKQFDINVKGAYFTVQSFLPLLKQGSSVILTASAVVDKGVPNGSLYFATKAAVRSFARTLAAELAPRQIRVNTLSPGIVRTHFADKTNLEADQFEGFVNRVVEQTPLARPGTAEEMAQAAVFLAGKDSSYMTGADLLVDGGWSSI